MPNLLAPYRRPTERTWIDGAPGLLRRSGTLLFGLTFAAAVALTGCSTSSSSDVAAGNGGGRQPKDAAATKLAKTTPTRDPAPAPKVGECHDLTFGDVGRYSNADQTTGCARSHTSLTFAVEKLPEDIAFDGVEIGNAAVQERASLLCRARFARYIGGSAATRALSRLSVTYFLPTQSDFDAGSRWVRCDVIALQSTRILADLPNPVKDFNTTESALDDFGVCSRGEPGTTSALLVMCDQDHQYRALAALRLGSGAAAYPGDTVVGTEGQQRCNDYISGTLGLGGGYTYAWTYPSSADWANGQRFGFCWNMTSN